MGPALRGSDFQTHWGAGDVAALFAVTKSTMPQANPGSLTDSDYAAIIAFILQSNGYKQGATEIAHRSRRAEPIEAGMWGIDAPRFTAGGSLNASREVRIPQQPCLCRSESIRQTMPKQAD